MVQKPFIFTPVWTRGKFAERSPANAVLLLLQLAAALVSLERSSSRHQAGTNRSISLAFVVVCIALFHIRPSSSILSGCLPAHVAHRDILLARQRLAVSVVVPETPISGQRWRTRLPRSTSARSGCTNSSPFPRPTAAEGVTAAAGEEEAAASGSAPSGFTRAAAVITEAEVRSHEEEEVFYVSSYVIVTSQEAAMRKMPEGRRVIMRALLRRSARRGTRVTLGLFYKGQIPFCTYYLL